MQWRSEERSRIFVARDFLPGMCTGLSGVSRAD